MAALRKMEDGDLGSPKVDRDLAALRAENWDVAALRAENWDVAALRRTAACVRGAGVSGCPC